MSDTRHPGHRSNHRYPQSRRHFAALASACSLLALSIALASTNPAAAAEQNSSTIQLPAVDVAGVKENARTPTSGYSAGHSISGTKSDTPLLETPQAISTITKDLINDQNARGLNQIVRYVAGVTAETRGAVATRYDQMNIRGFSANYYLDGMKLQNLYYIQPQIDSYFLERLDVVKGPASVLYGQAQAGGLLNQVSKLPLDTPFHEVGVDIGNFEHFRSVFDTTGPIDKEKRVLYRLTGVGLSEDGQFDHTQNQRYSLQGALTFRPSALTTLTILGHYLRDPKGSSYGGIPAVGTVVDNPLGKIPVNFYDGDPNFETFDRRQSGLGYQFEHKPDDVWTFRANGRWIHSVQDYESVYASTLLADNRTLTRGTATSHERSDTLTFDTSAQAKFATGAIDHTLLAGVDYLRTTGQYTFGLGTAPSIDVFNPVYYRTITKPAMARTSITGEQTGIYVQDQARFGGFVVTLSGRHDWAETRSETRTGLTVKTDQAFTGRAGLTYVFANGIAPYVAYGESFTPVSGTDYYGKPFDPERGTQYEAGVKYQPPGTNSLFTAAVFDLTRSNLSTTDTAHNGFRIQTGEARSRGLELEARGAVTANIDLVATYTYLDTVYTKDNSGLQDKRLAAIPHHAGSVWGVYSFHDGALAGLRLGGGVRVTGATFNPSNTVEVPGVTLVDAMAAYDLGKASPKLEGAEVTLNAKNLLNKEYVASCYSGTWCAYGYQRTVVAGLRYRW